MHARGALCLVAVTLGCSGVDIQHGLDERQTNQILVALDQAGISADKVKEEGGREATYKLQVPRGDATQAWKVLQAQELPRDVPKGMVELFGQPSLIPTQTQERALHQAALSGELSRTLQAIEGVLTARVHLTIPEENPLREGDRRAPSAAVLIKVRAGAVVPEEEVRRLVAGGVDGLVPARVSLVTTVGLAPSVTVAADLVHVGPFRVARSSRAPLLVTLIGALGLVFTLAGLVVLATVRAARASRRAAAGDQTGEQSLAPRIASMGHR